MQSTAHQTINLKDPGFIWHGALVPVVNENDNAILNEPSLHRFLLEVPWYPTVALEDSMPWEDYRSESLQGFGHERKKAALHRFHQGSCRRGWHRSAECS